MAIDDEEDLLEDMYGAPEDADTLLTKENRRSRRKTSVPEDLATAYLHTYLPILLYYYIIYYTYIII
jgi:hypothetical protein